MHRDARLAAFLSATILLTACSGLHSAPSLPADGTGSQSTADGAAAHRAHAELRLKIPKRNPRSHYVSPATASLKIYEGAELLGSFATTPNSNGCSTVNGGTLCSFVLRLAPSVGKTPSTFVIQTFDATGNMLSTGSVAQLIVAGPNVIRVTLGGVVTSIVVTIVNPNPPAGVAATSGIIVTGYDFDHEAIVGPGSYVNTSNAAAPITLTDTDTSGATSFAVNGVAGAAVSSPSDSVQLLYLKGTVVHSVGRVTIGASAPNVPAANVTSATFLPTPAVVGDFKMPPGGQTTVPITPSAIANGPDGNLYVAVYSGNSANDGIVQMSTTGSVTNYFVNGITPSSELPAVQITGLTSGPGSAIWYAGGGHVGSLTTAGAVNDYLLASAPGICTGDAAQRIVPSADGGLWVSISCNTDSQVAHVTATGTVVVYPLTNFSLASAGRMGVGGGMVLGKDGNLYVAGHDNNTGQDAVAQVPVVSGTLGTPVFGDVANDYGSLIGVAQSADGDFWATTDNCGTPQLVRFHPASPWSASNTQGFNTNNGCSVPAFLTALPDDSLWLPESNYPVVARAIPGVFPAAPAISEFVLPSPYSVPGREWDTAVGSDGDLYVMDNSSGSTFSGDVVKVAY